MGSDWRRNRVRLEGERGQTGGGMGSNRRGNGVGLEGEWGQTGGNRVGQGVRQGSDGKVYMKSNILIYA